MFLRLGVTSLGFLIASRLLGILRESAMAAAFGNSALGDIVVLMFTLPDLLASVLVSGALAYVLLPQWAGQSNAYVAQTQRTIATRLLLLGVAIALMAFAFPIQTLSLLANGVPAALLPTAATGLLWTMCAVPLALLASLWVTRLQHTQDIAGMYGASLAVNLVFVMALYALAHGFPSLLGPAPLGMVVWFAMVARLLWLYFRLRLPVLTEGPVCQRGGLQLPSISVWAWAAVSSGLPLVLPFVARSYASHGGAGYLATFNYAWKLVELPLVLAIQLVASLALPVIARAAKSGAGDGRSSSDFPENATRAARGAFLLAWTLACSAIAALQLGAWGIAQLLFGWGRMPGEGVAAIASWGAIGSWTLLPQSFIAVAMALLAIRGRMHFAAAAYFPALAITLVGGVFARGDGTWLMASLIGALMLCALMQLIGLRSSGLSLRGADSIVPWRPMLRPLGIAVSLSFAAHEAQLNLDALGPIIPLIICALAGGSVAVVSYFLLPELRATLKR
jgi:peptidoglycan biosynthesis protein MviN/MurJ (putative lipid II flippase)